MPSPYNHQRYPRLRWMLWALPLLLFACDGNTSGSQSPSNPLNHTSRSTPFNHNGQESPNNSDSASNNNNHQSDRISPTNHGVYGNKGGSTAGGLRLHLCNCLVLPTSDLIIPRRYYSVCATDPINAETYSYTKCRPLILSTQRCSSCVCTPTIACSNLGASL